MGMNPSHILWDHDGVLVDTEPLYYRATSEALRRMGVDAPLDVYLEYMARGRTSWDLAREAGFSESDIDQYRAIRDEMYQSLLVREPIEVPGVVDVLDTLSAHFDMAIVTTCKKPDFELIHRERDIVRHMAFVLAGGDYPREKPAPDPYLAALDRFGIGPGDAVAVEDSERGLASARAAGIPCIVVHNAFTATHNFEGAAAFIDTLDALPALLGVG